MDFVQIAKDWGAILTAILAAVTLVGVFYGLLNKLLNTRFDAFNARFDGFETRFDGFEARLDGFESRLSGVESRLGGFEARFEGFNARLDGFNTRLDGFKDEIRDIKGDIHRINDRIDQLFLVVHRVATPAVVVDSERHAAPAPAQLSDTAKTKSPITLTEKGHKIALKVDAQSLVDKYAGRVLLAEDADKLTIQQTCFNFAYYSLLSLANRQEREVIREAIYEVGGNANEILVIYGILLRDYHLKKIGLPTPDCTPDSIEEKE